SLRMRADGRTPGSAPEFAIALGARQIRLHVVAAALVHELPSHGATGVSSAIARRRQLAAHAVDALPEHDLNAVQAFAQHDDLDYLAVAGSAHFDLFVFHGNRFLRTWPRYRPRPGRFDATHRH